MASVVVFDFDKTLSRYDTVLPFFVFCASRNGFRSVLLPVYFLLKVFSKVGLITVKKEKELGLQLLCPRRYVDFQEYARKYALKVKSEGLNHVYSNEFIRHKNAGDRVVIASASFVEYLQHIFPDELVIGSECSVGYDGRISGLLSHPYKEAKAQALRQAGVEVVDVFYTDSVTDMPVVEMSHTVKWVKNGVVIR